MLLADMSLHSRVNIFADIISNTLCTDLTHQGLPVETAVEIVMNWLREIRTYHRTLYIVGNGGSAAIASHALVDFVNVAQINAHVLHESTLMTCMANDYGYEHVYSRILSIYIKPNDLLIAISSSGKSLNICNAAKVVKEKGAQVITLTGFDENNSLKQLGNINFWLDSHEYGYVEVGHQFILHNLSDRFKIEMQKNTLMNKNTVMGSAYL